ncbi:MAG: single-stranded-DNA-specific exonuclease RecJ, partial [Acidobacteriota bacterium]|nr:single-stranded-DNA-specific exonuclease RecJ [Acidobacteriota bacterium]
TALRALGAHVEAYIPNRFTDGYGMRVPAVEALARGGARVVLSVDTGIREHEALARLADLGVDAIVTDHHLPGDSLPKACAILNPRRPDCNYPEKNLAGVGVAFKLAHALLGMTEASLRSYLKVVAIGSIADVVPLTGENRIIASAGLAGLNQSAASPALSGKPGIASLLAAAGLGGKAVTAGDVAFRVAPRLNAAGRMEDARRVIDLFTCNSAGEAQEIAAWLDDLNHDRQRAEDAIVGAIKEQMTREPEKAGHHSLLFAGEGWHRGVIGIAAQRVVDLYHRPALVLAIDDGIAYGSGRSIPGFHLLNALTRSGHLLSRFGGHAQAAGFSLPVSGIQQLEEEFEAYARAVLTPRDLEPQLRVDAAVRLEDLDEQLMSWLKQLEPFGCGNPTPIFSASAELAFPPRIVKEKHLKLCIRDGKKRFDAMGWNMAGRAPALQKCGRMELAFSLTENTFQNRTTIELILKDIRPG